MTTRAGLVYTVAMRALCSICCLVGLVVLVAACTTTKGHFCTKRVACETVTAEQCEVDQDTLFDSASASCKGPLDSVIACWSTNSFCQDKRLYLLSGKCAPELKAYDEAGCPNVVPNR